jgi:hypothetical protein
MFDAFRGRPTLSKQSINVSNSCTNGATFPQTGECHLQTANPTDVANHPANSDHSFLLHCANFALLPGVLRRKGVD